jgi:hypothetical protein
VKRYAGNRHQATINQPVKVEETGGEDSNGSDGPKVDTVFFLHRLRNQTNGILAATCRLFVSRATATTCRLYGPSMSDDRQADALPPVQELFVDGPLMTSSLTWASPALIIPTFAAAADDRSIMRPP